MIILLVFHFEISGNCFNDEHSRNNPEISLILFVFHFEISGKLFIDEHPLNNPDISYTLFIFHFEILVNSIQCKIILK